MFQLKDLNLKIHQFFMDFRKVLFLDHYYSFFTSIICILLSNSARFIILLMTNLLHISKFIKKLNKFLNFDLKNLSNWLNANEISLNVSKTELILFKPRMKKVDLDLKLKLSAKRNYSIKSVKYLGIKIDESFTWNEHINL